MSPDFFDETFADLEKFYPGSKRKRRDVVDKSPTITDWEDEFFKKILPNGKEVQMYTLGSVAKALGRSTKTLRAWMEEGKLPTSPYRLPSKVGKNGKEYAGRRLYSKAMVDATVEIFAKAGLLEIDRVDWVLHRKLVDKIAEAWETIRAEEMQNTN
jgi:hypothetical protein